VTAVLAEPYVATLARDANLSAKSPAVWGVSRRIGSASVSAHEPKHPGRARDRRTIARVGIVLV
jgi:hypothetical protein